MGMITRNTQVLFERAEVITYSNSQLAMHKILHDVLTVGCYCNFGLFGLVFFYGDEKCLHYCRRSKLGSNLSFSIESHHCLYFQGSVLNLTGTAKG